MAGLFLRNDNSVENGGNTLGVSILRGDSTWTDLSGNGDGIPDALVPVNRTGTDTPLIVLWAQKDRNDDDLITPLWQYTTVIGGQVVQLWPEEREWLAYAALPTNYCLLESGHNPWFDDWMTLMVRIHEHVLGAPSGSFSAGGPGSERHPRLPDQRGGLQRRRAAIPRAPPRSIRRTTAAGARRVTNPGPTTSTGPCSTRTTSRPATIISPWWAAAPRRSTGTPCAPRPRPPWASP